MTDFIDPEIEATDDGSNTLKHPVLGDHYHSTRGALGEARHIFIDNGFNAIDKSDVRIFEAGFGSGLNALLTLKEALAAGKNVEYHAAELYPVSLETIEKLNYIDRSDPLYPCFLAMHAGRWGEVLRIHERFTLIKYRVSLLDMKFDTTFDITYFDAFAPDSQPELWSREVFSNLYGHTENGGALVTYSAKGSVKQALRDAGFEVTRLPGALGKRHMVKAIKPQ